MKETLKAERRDEGREGKDGVMEGREGGWDIEKGNAMLKQTTNIIQDIQFLSISLPLMSINFQSPPPTTFFFSLSLILAGKLRRGRQSSPTTLPHSCNSTREEHT